MATLHKTGKAHPFLPPPYLLLQPHNKGFQKSLDWYNDIQKNKVSLVNEEAYDMSKNKIHPIYIAATEKEKSLADLEAVNIQLREMLSKKDEELRHIEDETLENERQIDKKLKFNIYVKVI